MPPEKESFIEKMTGARPGTPESILKNAQAVNPNYGKEKGYDKNCQRCFPAYELRRRGHDVEAMPNYEEGSGTSKRDFFAGWECFRDAKVKGFFHGDEPIGRERLFIELKGLPDGARAGIIWTWPDKNRSHIIACEKLAGQLIIIDPQKGTVDPATLGEADKEIGYTLFRADNLEIKEDFEWREIIKKK